MPQEWKSVQVSHGPGKWDRHATQIFFIFTRRQTIHFDLYIFFKWLETTKLKIIGFVSYFVTLIICFFHFGFMPGQEPDGELCGKLQFL